MAAYHHAGITADPRTWARPAPVLPALATALRAAKPPAATALADAAGLAAGNWPHEAARLPWVTSAYPES